MIFIIKFDNKKFTNSTNYNTQPTIFFFMTFRCIPLPIQEINVPYLFHIIIVETQGWSQEVDQNCPLTPPETAKPNRVCFVVIKFLTDILFSPVRLSFTLKSLTL